MIVKSFYQSPVGTIILTSDGEFLTGLWFTTSRFPELRLVNQEQINDDLPVFKITKHWLDPYFAGEQPDPKTVPLKLVGNDFSQSVWQILATIPYGQTTTYGEIAKIIAAQRGSGAKMSAQAVGHAVGYNPISIIIPCHRVIGANGNLTGYGGGLDVKIALLKHEKVALSKKY